jgi:class 3 adenylate cyclase/ligand-binding sensor domain-containing protein
MDLFEDRTGNLWLGTFSGGVNMFDGRRIVRYTDKEGLTNNQVRTISEDTKGNILIGTFGAGLFILDDKSVRHYSEKDGLSDFAVTNICKDSRGNYWFGTEEGGVNVYDGRTFQHLMIKDGLSSNRVWPVIEDHRGDIWFGTWNGGAYRFDGKKVTNYTKNSGLSSTTVLTIYEDSKKDLLFGTFGGGITIYDGSSFRHITEKEGLSNIHVISILEDSKGHYWFGTVGGGVTQYNGRQFRHFTEREGLGGNTIRFIHEDHFGNIWFGTDGAGISIYDGTRFTYLTEREGLSDNYVTSIVRDQDQYLWVGTSKGLTRISIRPDSSSSCGYTFTPQVFSGQDGLKGIDFYLQSSYIDDNGRSWWGTDKGLVTIDHSKLRLSTGTPSLAIKNIDINGHFVDYHNLDSTKYSDLTYSRAHVFENYPLDLVLPHNSNHLTFHFAAVDWAAPHKVSYSYRMLGLGDSWSKPTSEAKADYRNIPFGEYTFQVCAIGESGSWSDPINYTFTIRPPWWHTWWAYSGYVLLTLLLLGAFGKWREQKLRAEKRLLEQTVDERTAELSREKRKSDDLLLNILPEDVAEELKTKGHAEARYFDEITVLFTDFKDFTSVAESMSPAELVREMHTCFEAFDAIVEKYGIEKIKTIGDAYMAAGGLSASGEDPARNTVLAALEMQDYIRTRVRQQSALGRPAFEMRVGIHTGPVVAGIVGVKKFQYDIWGDTVNTAARMESTGDIGRVNISQSTFVRVKDWFKCTHRGKIKAKNKGELDMYYVEGGHGMP